jgi:ribosome biogenesis GTPase
LENGGMVIDNPGMREVQLLNVDEGIKETFSDIEELASRCKFKDCRHLNEPKCAVKKAIEQETLPLRRLENYNKLNEGYASHTSGSGEG